MKGREQRMVRVDSVAGGTTRKIKLSFGRLQALLHLIRPSVDHDYILVIPEEDARVHFSIVEAQSHNPAIIPSRLELEALDIVDCSVNPYTKRAVLTDSPVLRSLAARGCVFVKPLYQESTSVSVHVTGAGQYLLEQAFDRDVFYVQNDLAFSPLNHYLMYRQLRVGVGDYLEWSIEGAPVKVAGTVTTVEVVSAHRAHISVQNGSTILRLPTLTPHRLDSGRWHFSVTAAERA